MVAPPERSWLAGPHILVFWRRRPYKPPLLPSSSWRCHVGLLRCGRTLTSLPPISLSSRRSSRAPLTGPQHLRLRRPRSRCASRRSSRQHQRERHRPADRRVARIGNAAGCCQHCKRDGTVKLRSGTLPSLARSGLPLCLPTIVTRLVDVHRAGLLATTMPPVQPRRPPPKERWIPPGSRQGSHASVRQADTVTSPSGQSSRVASGNVC